MHVTASSSLCSPINSIPVPRISTPLCFPPSTLFPRATAWIRRWNVALCCPTRFPPRNALPAYRALPHASNTGNSPARAQSRVQPQIALAPAPPTPELPNMIRPADRVRCPLGEQRMRVFAKMRGCMPRGARRPKRLRRPEHILALRFLTWIRRGGRDHMDDALAAVRFVCGALRRPKRLRELGGGERGETKRVGGASRWSRGGTRGSYPAAIGMK
ncbi:hypothetical protein C8R44DRAFT_19407 [Mycena epipterygia]|nr:hypothetical protein C8R44DRAFT_19407 [Mycena epipterygia]